MSNYRRLLQYIHNYRLLFLLLLLSVLLGGFTTAYPPQIMKKFIDLIADKKVSGFSDILYPGLQYLFFLTTTSVLYVLRTRTGRALQARIFVGLITNVYDKVQKLPMSFFENRQVGDLMSRIVDDTKAISEQVMPLIMLSRITFDFTWSVFFMIRMDWIVFASSLSIAPVALLIMLRFGTRAKNAWQKVREADSDTKSILLEKLLGLREIKAFTQEDVAKNQIYCKGEKTSSLEVKAYMLQAYKGLSMDLLFSIGTVVVLIFGGFRVYQGSITVGALPAFITYLHMLYNPFITLSSHYDILQKLRVSAERIFEIMDIPVEEGKETRKFAFHPIKGNIVFDNISFGYKDGENVIKNISFTIPEGQIVGIAGKSGCGKSTIANLIMQFYKPREGKIYIDGMDISTIPLQVLRKQIGFVGQGVFLFNLSLRDNIALGNPSASEEEIFRCAKIAKAHEFICSLPKGYATICGERGATLSGGQKQRIAIARALLCNPGILILDEATSELDSETEQAILNALRVCLPNRTIMLITHRLSLYEKTDNILVIDDNRLVEEGTYDYLLTKNGIYANLLAT